MGGMQRDTPETTFCLRIYPKGLSTSGKVCAYLLQLDLLKRLYLKFFHSLLCPYCILYKQTMGVCIRDSGSDIKASLLFVYFHSFPLSRPTVAFNDIKKCMLTPDEQKKATFPAFSFIMKMSHESDEMQGISYITNETIHLELF
jgi:hypothetical protein